MNMKDDIREDLTNLKQQFHKYLRSHNSNSIPINILASIPRKYFNIQSSLLANIVARSNNKLGIQSQQITWDGLLEFLQTQMQLKDQVNKINNMKFSIIQAHFVIVKDYQEIIKYVKSKQTNIIKEMKKVQIGLKDIVVVRLEKQIILYDCQTHKISNFLHYKYQKMKEKILEKNHLKKQRDSTLLRQSQGADKVNNLSSGQRVNPSSGHRGQQYFQRKNTAQSQELKNIIMPQMKKSIIGSAIPSQIAIKNRSITDAGDIFAKNKKSPQKKANLLKFRNNQTNTIFKIFQQTSIPNSIQIAKAFVQSRQTFQSHITVQKQWTIPQQKQQIDKPSQISIRKDYRGQLKKMRTFSKYLSSSRNQQTINSSRQQKILQKNTKKKQIKQGYQHLQDKTLQIQCMSLVQDFLLVALHSRQVRLYKFKKSLYNFRQQLIFQKTYDTLPIHVLLYRSTVRQLFNKVVCLARQSTTRIIISELNSSMEIQSEIFKVNIDFIPIFRNILPFGIAGYNQVGWISLIELNSSISSISQKKSIQKQYKNPNQKQQIGITCIAIHSNLIEIYMSCKLGYIYIIDKHTQEIRFFKKITNCKIIDFTFLNNSQEIMVWTSSNKLKIVNRRNLQVSYQSQPTSSLNRNVNFSQRIMMINLDRYIVYSQRSIHILNITKNQQKQFQNQKPIKIYKNRQKIFLRNKNLNKTVSNIRQQNILNIFIDEDDQSIGVITKQYQLIIYDKQLDYVGSYYNLELGNALKIKLCNQKKFIAIIYQSGSIQVINLYTQQIVLNINQPNDQISTIFFGNTNTDFLGLVTKNLTIYLYSIKNQVKKIDSKQLHSINNNTFINKIYGKYLSNRLLSWNYDQFIIHHPKTYSRNYNIKIPNNYKINKVKYNFIDQNIYAIDQNNNSLLKIYLKQKEIKILYQSNCKLIDYSLEFQSILQLKDNSTYILYYYPDKKIIKTFQKNIMNIKKVQIYGKYILAYIGNDVKIYNQKGDFHGYLCN